MCSYSFIFINGTLFANGWDLWHNRVKHFDNIEVVEYAKVIISLPQQITILKNLKSVRNLGKVYNNYIGLIGDRIQFCRIAHIFYY